MSVSGRRRGVGCADTGTDAFRCQRGAAAYLVIDDGLATGVTAIAALRAVRQGQPHRLVFAVLICAMSSAAALRDEADEVICVAEPERFGAVSLWYDDFGQTSDEEVTALLPTALVRSR